MHCILIAFAENGGVRNAGDETSRQSLCPEAESILRTTLLPYEDEFYDFVKARFWRQVNDLKQIS